MSASIVDESNEASLFQAVNFGVVPVWAAMILAPNARITERIVRASDAVLAVYAAAYVAQLAGVMAANQETPDFRDVSALRTNMARPEGFLVGWTHFLAFDLFVGRWIWATAKAEGRSARLAMLCTFMFGPAGLGLFGLQRRSLRPTPQL